MFCLNIKSQHIPARYFSFCVLLTVLLVIFEHSLPTRRIVHNRCAVYGCRRPLDYSQRSSADNRSVIDPFGIDLYLPAISYLHISCSSLRHFWRDVGSAVFCAVGHGGGSLHLVPNFSKSWKPHSSLCCFMRIRSGNRL